MLSQKITVVTGCVNGTCTYMLLEDMFLLNKTLAYRLFALSWFYSKIIRFVIGVISPTLTKMVYLHSRKSNRKNKEYETRV